MNIKLITKALHTLSLLSEEDYDLLMKLRSLSESEREALVLVLEPQTTAKKKSTAKQRHVEKCVACNRTRRALIHRDPNADSYHEFPSPLPSQSNKPATKSARAQSLGEQIQKRPRGVVTGDDGEDDGFCRYQHNEGNGHVCGLQQDHNVHHLENMVDYHPFTPAAPVATAASKSSRQSTLTESVANSETVEGTAGNAVHGASGGD